MDNQPKKNLYDYISAARSGTISDVDGIVNDLNMNIPIAQTKIIDYALSFVSSSQGVARMEHFLFHGTRMQRNYCALFLIEEATGRLCAGHMTKV